MRTKQPGGASKARSDAEHGGPFVLNPDDKPAFVRAMFSRIANRYDLMNRVMTFGMDLRWRRIAGKKLQAEDGTWLLDVATGTGDFAIALRRLYPRCRVVGLDFSAGMLDVATPKLAADDGVLLLQADGYQIPFADSTFDGAVSAFALRNVPDIPGFLAEMQRVVKPGRSVVILEIARPTLPGFRELYQFYFGRFVPRIGAWLSGDSQAYSYLPASVEQFATPTQLQGMFEGVGLESVRVRRLGLGSIVLVWGTKPATGSPVALREMREATVTG
jgi:demethylmenaquinone methyltransferase/2-methoxy-6-polyprenyl-1,4-benzoquinol methylase